MKKSVFHNSVIACVLTTLFLQAHPTGVANASGVMTRRYPKQRILSSKVSGNTASSASAATHISALRIIDSPSDKLSNSATSTTGAASQAIKKRRSFGGTLMSNVATFQRTKLSIESWIAIDLVTVKSLDPVEFSLNNVQPGSRYVIELQQRSAPLGIDLGDPALSMQKIRAAVSRSLRYRSIIGGTADENAAASFIAPNGEVIDPRSSEVLPIEVPVHAPVKASIFDKQGKRIGFTQTKVQGRVWKKILGERGSNVQESGLFQVHYDVWAVPENMWMTPSMETSKKLQSTSTGLRGTPKRTARFTALAAFPAGVVVTIRNKRSGELVRGTASDTGSVDMYVPAGDEDSAFEITAAFPAEWGRARESAWVADISLPARAGGVRAPERAAFVRPTFTNMRATRGRDTTLDYHWLVSNLVGAASEFENAGITLLWGNPKIEATGRRRGYGFYVQSSQGGAWNRFLKQNGEYIQLLSMTMKTLGIASVSITKFGSQHILEGAPNTPYASNTVVQDLLKPVE